MRRIKWHDLDQRKKCLDICSKQRITGKEFTIDICKGGFQIRVPVDCELTATAGGMKTDCVSWTDMLLQKHLHFQKCGPGLGIIFDKDSHNTAAWACRNLRKFWFSVTANVRLGMPVSLPAHCGYFKETYLMLHPKVNHRLSNVTLHSVVRPEYTKLVT